MQLQTSKQSILASIFCIGLLWLSAGTYKATASTAADVVTSLVIWNDFGHRWAQVR